MKVLRAVFAAGVQGADQEPDHEAEAGRGQGRVRREICTEVAEGG